jgi:hypothetical protein
MNQTLLPASERLKTVNLAKSSTKSHTQLQRNKLCTRFSAAPVLKKYAATGYTVHVQTENKYSNTMQTCCYMGPTGKQGPVL